MLCAISAFCLPSFDSARRLASLGKQVEAKKLWLKQLSRQECHHSFNARLAVCHAPSRREYYLYKRYPRQGRYRLRYRQWLKYKMDIAWQRFWHKVFKAYHKFTNFSQLPISHQLAFHGNYSQRISPNTKIMPTSVRPERQ
ncbi:hypothetical protein VTO42DRAFT_4004 [Malbranchea cinnamomea]